MGGKERRRKEDDITERYLTRSGGHIMVGRSVDVESQKSLYACMI
jgi:hypothetical protein